jgi:hypothetical protein
MRGLGRTLGNVRGRLDVTPEGLIGRCLDVASISLVGGGLDVAAIGLVGRDLDVASISLVGGGLDVAAIALVGRDLDVASISLVGGGLDVAAIALVGRDLDVAAIGLVGRDLDVATIDLVGRDLDVAAIGLVGRDLDVAAIGLVGRDLDVAAIDLVGRDLDVASIGLVGMGLDVTFTSGQGSRTLGKTSNSPRTVHLFEDTPQPHRLLIFCFIEEGSEVGSQRQKDQAGSLQLFVPDLEVWVEGTIKKTRRGMGILDLSVDVRPQLFRLEDLFDLALPDVELRAADCMEGLDVLDGGDESSTGRVPQQAVEGVAHGGGVFLGGEVVDWWVMRKICESWG